MITRGAALISFLALFSASCFADTVLGSTSDGRLYSIIPETGQEALIGTLSSTGSGNGTAMYDIAGNDTALYGIDLFGTVYAINPQTAQTSQIGTNPGIFINALTFGQNGVLYGVGRDSLYTINTNTGAATLVGSGTVNGGTAYNSSGDVEYLNGQLYLTSFNGNGMNDSFFTINPTTGKGTQVSTLDFGNVFGLEYSNQTLYGFTDPSTDVSGNGQILIINPNTGVATVHANYSTPFWGVTTFDPVPEPATIGLIGAGLGVLLLFKRRRRV